MASGVKGRRLNPPRQAGAIIIPPHYGLSLAPFLSFFFFSSVDVCRCRSPSGQITGDSG